MIMTGHEHTIVFGFVFLHSSRNFDLIDDRDLPLQINNIYVIYIYGDTRGTIWPPTLQMARFQALETFKAVI